MKGKFVVVCALFLAGCGVKQSSEELSSIQLSDRNGFQETISSKERLARFEAADFTSPQVYERVVRTYKRDASGRAKAIFTTYHENGTLWRYLEGENGRARGVFQEFHPNGMKKVEAVVIEGMTDFSPGAMEKWVFDGVSKAWNEQGVLLAEVVYERGRQHGMTTYYHANGEVRSQLPYRDGLLRGEVKVYGEAGNLVSIVPYVDGEKQGRVCHYGDEFSPHFEEVYDKGLLIEGEYYSFTGDSLGGIHSGSGIRYVFADGAMSKKVSYEKGVPCGSVVEYDECGNVSSEYMILDDEKHGEERVFYEDGVTPKLSLSWYKGCLQGVCITWYPNGSVQSKLEMHENVKHGMSFAWYEDGGLMLSETYEKGKLVSGKYFKSGEEAPVSSVEGGRGTATLFDKAGVVTERIQYLGGLPVEE